MKIVTGSLVCVMATASFALADVGVNVSTPNVSVRVGSPQPAPVIVQQERVVVREREVIEKHDNGKHKGHYKKHKKHKKHDRD